MKNTLKVNYCGGKAQERMIKNGWTLVIRQTVKDEGAIYRRQETEEELYERCTKTYAKVRLYWCSTYVRGIHEIFAMCK